MNKILIIKCSTASFLPALQKIQQEFPGVYYLYTKETDKNVSNIEKIYHCSSKDHMNITDAVKDMGNIHFHTVVTTYNNETGDGYQNIDAIAQHFSNNAYFISNSLQIHAIEHSLRKRIHTVFLQITSLLLKSIACIIYTVLYLCIRNENE